MAKEKETIKQDAVMPKFSYEQLVNCSKFVGDKVLLASLLDKKEEYTIEEAEKLIEDYKKRRV